jgi:hypothetical protein
MRVTEQIAVLYPDANIAAPGYASFPKSWDAAHGPLSSYVLVRHADDADRPGRSFILKTRGADIPWDGTAAPPPRVAVSESAFAEMAGRGDRRGVVVTFQKATVGIRFKRRLRTWLTTGWVLPTLGLVGDGKTAAN